MTFAGHSIAAVMDTANRLDGHAVIVRCACGWHHRYPIARPTLASLADSLQTAHDDHQAQLVEHDATVRP